MSNRTINLPGKINLAEHAYLARRAAKLGVSPAAYLRQRLKLAPIQKGAPVGNTNNPHGRAGNTA